MINLPTIQKAATMLRTGVAEIQAVAEVESGGSGFLATGEPRILFEPHVFWRELQKRNIDPRQFRSEGDILYKTWGEKPYGKNGEQHGRLQRASDLHREAALSSCSWGKFQIMGNNWLACGCDSLQQFVNMNYKTENEHLWLFCNFIVSNELDGYLRTHQWEKFAARYNGPSYKKNAYHLKLPIAFKKYSNV